MMKNIQNKTLMNDLFKELKMSFQVPDYLLLVLIFVSVSYTKLTPFFLVLFIVSNLFYINRWSLNFKEYFRLTNPVLWCIVFYISHIIALIWTENTTFASADLGMKLSFLIFPILTFILKSRVKLDLFLKFFCVSLTLTVLFLLINAFAKSVYNPEDNHFNYFFESEFSAFMHRSYFATYTSLGAVFSVLLFLKNKTSKWYLFSSVLLSLATFLTISKAGIIILIICLFSLFIGKMIQNRKWIFLIFGTIPLLVITFTAIKIDPRIASRFEMISVAIKEIKLYNNPDSESNEARLIMWNTSVQLIKEHPFFGVGTGDVKDELIAKNVAFGNAGVADKKLNSHNQYLNTWVQVGFLGFVSLFLLFVMLFRRAILQKDIFLFYFSLIFCLSLLVESFFETQAGIVPFNIFVFLFLKLKKEDLTVG